jgi:hypothetical protein
MHFWNAFRMLTVIYVFPIYTVTSWNITARCDEVRKSKHTHFPSHASVKIRTPNLSVGLIGDVVGSGDIAVFIVDQLHAPAASLPGPVAGLDTVTYLSSVTILYRLRPAGMEALLFALHLLVTLHGSFSRQQQKKWQVWRSHPKHSCSGCVQSGADHNTCRATRRQPTALYLCQMFGTKSSFHLKPYEMPALRGVLEIQKFFFIISQNVASCPKTFSSRVDSHY